MGAERPSFEECVRIFKACRYKKMSGEYEYKKRPCEEAREFICKKINAKLNKIWESYAYQGSNHAKR
ncbi:MAG: hypothetical protein J6M14_01630 [Campylobacter sp.]|nr:hypothetical protein [Campylobacter sp.]